MSTTDEPRQPEAGDAEDDDDAEWEEFDAPVPPDGGWGWVVMISSFLSNVIVDGVCYTYSVFFNELLDYFGASRGKTALVGALVPAFYLLVGTTTYTRVVVCQGHLSGTEMIIYLSGFDAFQAFSKCVLFSSAQSIKLNVRSSK